VAAEDQGVTAVIYPWLQQSTALPSGLVPGLRKSCEQALILREYYRTVLRELGPYLKPCGRVVLLQGAALDERLYGESMVRPLSDVDLYFPDHGIAPARKILTEHGFTPLGRYSNVWERQGLHLDLHEDLWGADRIPARALFAPQTPPVLIPSRTLEGYHLLADSFLCLQAVMHGLKHGFSRRIWLWDLVLLRQAGVFSDVKSIDRCGLCEIALQHLARLGLIDPPGSEPGRSAPSLRKRLIDRALVSACDSGSGELLLALCSGSWSRTVYYLFSSVFPPRRILAEMYGDHPLALLALLRLRSLLFPKGTTGG
jgi:hypothetical protein